MVVAYSGGIALIGKKIEEGDGYVVIHEPLIIRMSQHGLEIMPVIPKPSGFLTVRYDFMYETEDKILEKEYDIAAAKIYRGIEIPRENGKLLDFRRNGNGNM